MSSSLIRLADGTRERTERDITRVKARNTERGGILLRPTSVLLICHLASATGIR
jgi:hypothetical protein